MPTFLMGHGGMADGDVTIPEGMTISFLTDEGNSLPFYNGVGFILNYADLIRGGFKVYGPFQGGTEIQNRVLEPLKSHQRAWYAQVDPEDGSCMYAGESFDAPILLCNDPDQCAQNPEGVHTCGGLFSFAWADPDLVWVSCQAAPGGEVQESVGSEGDTRYSDFVDGVVQRFEARASDEEFASYFDTLSDDQIAMVMVDRGLRSWSYRRQGRKFLEENGEAAYAAMVDSAGDLAYLYKGFDADLDDAYEKGTFVRQSRASIQGNDPQVIREWYEGLDPAYQQVIVNDPEFRDIVRQAPGNLRADVDWAAVHERNQEALAALCARGQQEATTTLSYNDEHLLIGDGHPFAAVTALGQGSTPGGGQIRFQYNRIGPNELFVTAEPRAREMIQGEIDALVQSGAWDYMSNPRVRF